MKLKTIFWKYDYILKFFEPKLLWYLIYNNVDEPDNILIFFEPKHFDIWYIIMLMNQSILAKTKTKLLS